MKIKIALFVIAIAKVALANNLRREREIPESRELQTYIRGSPKSRGKKDGGRRKSNDLALIIVNDDDSDETHECADYTAKEFDRNFDVILFEEDDADAQDGDVVAVIDEYTDCDDLIDEIEKELGDRHSETTVYVYYGDGHRYYKNKNKGYRLYSDRKYKKSGYGYGGGKRYWYGYGGRRKYWDHHKKHWDKDNKDDKDDKDDKDKSNKDGTKKKDGSKKKVKDVTVTVPPTVP